jgi:hypothetical protein
LVAYANFGLAEFSGQGSQGKGSELIAHTETDRENGRVLLHPLRRFLPQTNLIVKGFLENKFDCFILQ